MMRRALAAIIVLVLVGGVSLRYRENLRPRIREKWEAVVLPLRIARLAKEPAEEKLPMPVAGIRVGQVADTWGASRGTLRKHEGQDMFAPQGTPVRSVGDGYVIRTASGMPLGGTIVVVAGRGGRVYYYAHLERHAPGIETGAPVSSSTILGYVGKTGNAEGTPPHLHFGMYTATGAINPLPLLADR